MQRVALALRNLGHPHAPIMLSDAPVADVVAQGACA